MKLAWITDAHLNFLESADRMGVDIAKNTFELCGINKEGAVCYSKRVSRAKFLETVMQLKVDKIGMEACGGANYWCRRLTSLGFKVKLMSPQYVKPYIQTNRETKTGGESGIRTRGTS